MTIFFYYSYSALDSSFIHLFLQVDKLLKDEATEEKGERARMVRLPPFCLVFFPFFLEVGVGLMDHAYQWNSPFFNFIYKAHVLNWSVLPVRLLLLEQWRLLIWSRLRLALRGWYGFNLIAIMFMLPSPCCDEKALLLESQDKILQSTGRGRSVTVTNDGATILKSLHIDNPAAKVLVGILLIISDGRENPFGGLLISFLFRW